MASRRIVVGLTVAAVVLLAGATAQAQSVLNYYEAPFGPGGTWNVYEVRGWGSDYGGTQNWYNAHQDAVGRTYSGKPGDLVSIGSAAENAFVWQIANQEDVWIGLNDDEATFGGTEGVFVWTNGDPPPGYTNWDTGTGEPSNSEDGEDAGMIWNVGGTAGTWNDHRSGIPGESQDDSPAVRYVVEYQTNTGSPQLPAAPTEILPTLVATPDEFVVREVVDNGDVTDLASLRASLTSGGGSIVDYTTVAINPHDSDGNGHFGLDSDFGAVVAGHDSKGGVDHLAAVAKAQIAIRSGQEGRYTFGVNSDDGFELILREAATGTIVPFSLKGGQGETVVTNYGSLAFDFGRVADDSFGRIDLPVGDYTVELLYWEATGGAAVELSMAQGDHTGFNSSFNLLSTVPIISGYGRIEAEDFLSGGEGVGYHDNDPSNNGGQYRPTEGVDIGAVDNPAYGGYNVGWTEPGEWLKHKFVTPDATRYALIPRVAKDADDLRELHLDIGGQTFDSGIDGNTGSWQDWVDAPTWRVDLAAGTQELTTTWVQGGMNFDYIEVIPFAPIAANAITRVQVEDYIEYYDTGASDNQGGAYRHGGVDMEGVQNTPGGTFGIGWTATNEWVTNGITVAQDGRYGLLPRVASDADGYTKQLRLEVAGQSGVVTTDAETGWQDWTNTTGLSVDLTAGHHELTTTWLTDSLNLDYIEVIPYTPIAAAGPSLVEFENYIAYTDTGAGNDGGQYRQGDVDIEVRGTGYTIGWTAAGETLTNGITVPHDGTYALIPRIASPDNYTNELGFAVDGGPQTVLSGLGSSDWAVFVDAPPAIVGLTAGHHELTTEFINGDLNADYIEVVPFTQVGTDPVRVQHEDYIEALDNDEANQGGAYRQGSVDIEVGGSSGHNVGWTAPGEWVRNGVDVRQDGRFAVSLVTGGHGDQIDVGLVGLPVSYSFTGLGTGSNTTFHESPMEILDVPACTYVIQSTWVDGNVNADYIQIIPFKPVSQAGPTRVEAEDFIDFSDTTPANEPGDHYRPTAVDIETRGTGFTIGYTETGENLVHGVTCVEPETYGFIYNYATPNNDRTMSLDIDGTPAGTTHLLNTGDWGAFQQAPAIYAPMAGHHMLQTTFDNGGVNLDYLDIIPLGHAPNVSTGHPVSLEAEHYHRMHGIEIGDDGAASNGQYVGWVDSGEWIAFDVLAANGGLHNIIATLATPNNACEVALYLDGIVEATFIIDSTGGWGNFEQFALGWFDLPAGYHELRMLSINGDINFDVFDVQYIPEPATLSLLGLGLLALARRRRRK